MTKIELFVAGNAPNSLFAKQQFEQALITLKSEIPQGNRLDVSIVDVMDSPDRAFDAGILMTPALKVTDVNGRASFHLGLMTHDKMSELLGSIARQYRRN